VFNRQVDVQTVFVRGSDGALREALDRIRQSDDERQARLWAARANAFGGRWREARELYLQTQAPAGNAVPRRPVPLPPEAIGAQALFGFCRPEDGNLALSPARLTSPRASYFPVVSLDGSLCGEQAAADQFADEAVKRFPESTATREVSIPVLRAAIALKRDQPQQAIDVLRAVGTGEGAAFLPYYLRGQSFLRLNRSAEAAAEFRTILEHRGWAPMSVYYPLAHLGLARALAMAGDVPGSRREYEAFFAMWKDADSDLPVLIDARQSYAQLK
jgi:hypothetical protein